MGQALAIALLVVSLGHLIHKHPRQVALFIGCGLLVPPLVLMGGDVIRGSPVGWVEVTKPNASNSFVRLRYR